MPRELPEDVSEAIDLLSSFEKSNDHSQKTRDFADAIDILNDFLRHNPESPHASYVRNLKVTYTRRLLEQLPKLATLNIDDWFSYSVPLLLNASGDVDAAINGNPDLEQNLKAFLAIWSDEAVRLL